MSVLKALLAACVAASLAACQSVPQGPVSLASEKLDAQSGRIGVAMTQPKVDLYLPGAGCLLCYAAASVANTSLNSYSHTLKDDELQQVKVDIVELLKKKGIDASAVDTPVVVGDLPKLDLGPNMATRDFASFARRYDHLVVIEIQQVGFVRTYAAYIPTSDPKATVVGTAYMVDLKTNKLEWFEPVAITKGADGAWDEGPTFPGLTNAYYAAIELGKDQLKKPFVN